MRRVLGGLLVCAFLVVFVLSRTEWGRGRIGALVRGRTVAGPADPGTKAPGGLVPLPTRRPRVTTAPAGSGSGRFNVMIGVDRSVSDGKIALTYSPARQLVDDSRLLTANSDYLSALFVLPRDIPVAVHRCGFSNAYWDPKAQGITVCDEFIEDMGRIFANERDPRAFRQSVMFATSFFMFHEVGHALVDVYRLASFGKQEDVADQIATLLLLGSDQGETVMTGADAFYRLAGSRPADAPRLFWDEHALNEQRFYNVVCWVYGQDPDRYRALVDDGVLPRERAERCPGEFADIVRSFEQHLRPHTRS